MDRLILRVILTVLGLGMVVGLCIVAHDAGEKDGMMEGLKEASAPIFFTNNENNARSDALAMQKLKEDFDKWHNLIMRSPKGQINKLDVDAAQTFHEEFSSLQLKTLVGRTVQAFYINSAFTAKTACNAVINGSEKSFVTEIVGISKGAIVIADSYYEKLQAGESKF